jgi:hypothetical protein
MKQTLLLVLLSLFALRSSAQSTDFEHDTSAVDMRMYWPLPPAGSTLTVTYRRYDGSLYAKRLTKKPNDPMSSWLPTSQQPGTHFSREDYIPGYYGPIGGYPPDDPIAYFNNSWSMVLRPDKSVSEIADSWPLWKFCVTWCSSRGQYYGYSHDPSIHGDIVHGRPGGHVLGESYYYKVDVEVWQTPDLQNKRPTYVDGLQIYSIIRMEQKYNSFTPEYGRAARSWAPGSGKSYPRTVKIVLQHGTRDPNSTESRCSYYPPGYVHRDGYTSFWQYIWYADGVGVIKETLLFDERPDEHNIPSCHGAAYKAAGVSNFAYDDYIDDPH